MITHPYIVAPVIVIYGLWIFLHNDDINGFNIGFSISIELTKALFAFTAIFGSIRLARKERIAGWWVISAACTFWFLGEIMFASTIFVTRRPELTTSVGDSVFLLAIPLAIVGVFLVGMHGLRGVERLRITIDSLAFTCALAFVSFTFLVELVSNNKALLQGDVWVQFCFFILDLTFASLAFSLILYRRYDKMIVPIAVGMIIQAGADMMWIIDEFRHSQATQPYARVVLLTSAALFCFTATRTNGRPTKMGNAYGDRQLRIGVFVMVLVTIIFALVRLPSTHHISPIVAFCFVSLFIVTLLGQIASHYENEKLSNEQKKSIDTLSESEERFRIAFENGPTGLLLVDAEGFIITANYAFGTMLSQDPTDLIGTELLLLIHPDDREIHLRRASNIALQATHLDYDVRFIEREGLVSWGCVSVSEMPIAEGESNVVYQIEDITDRKASEQRLQYLAIHDPLTGLANRTYFIERTDEALRIAKLDQQTLGVLFIDLDRFKVINDSLGHSVGDQVIQTISHRIRRVVGALGTVARFGGDEFTVLIAPPTDETMIHKIAKDILDEVIKPFPLGDGEAYISCSIGVLVTDGETHDPHSLLRDADSAMYRAKELGRNRIETADRQVHKRVMRELRTVNELHRAVAKDEMKVYYQPIVRLDTNEISGFEALVRWKHPERGIIAPDDFIPMAEDTGLILEIGTMVMNQAFRQLEKWQSSYCQKDGLPLTMSVNLAVRQLSDPNLLDYMDQIYQEVKTASNSMVFEITESVLLGDTRHAITILNEIHNLGYKLIVDDFGTGYSSLAYLKRFPIDGFKIDKSFVSGLDTDDNDTAIVHALIGLADSLHLGVIAEGVETQSARDSLDALGCTHGQGYLFSHAKPADKIKLPKNKAAIMAKIKKDSAADGEESTDVIDLQSRRPA